VYVQFGWLDPPANLVRRVIGQSRFVVCASPGYWAAHGVPLQPMDLERHVFVLFRMPDGAIHDLLRIRYLARHAAAVHQAIADGAGVRGYFAWSILDNFEWGFGFTKRFGLVHVDYQTQRRTVKDSGRWYGRLASDNRLLLSDANATL
jgi:hypothetical protein